jgi:17beta-estradiol 17-dehydrogenase / very-long-chain 3-oxoacyl-CoA reductase
VDFCTSDRGIYDVMRQKTADLDIAVLVNNVGLSYPYPEYYSLIPDGDKYVDNMIEANCTAATLLMRMVLPSMMEKRQGVIINLSSISAMHPVPLLSVYAGTKAYIDFLSQATAVEYSPFGIVVQSVKPAFVSTKLSKIRKSSWQVPTPETYVKSALLTVGLEDATYGYLPHKLRGYAMEFVVAVMPMRCLCKLSLRMLNMTRMARYKKDKTEDPLKKLKKQ